MQTQIKEGDVLVTDMGATMQLPTFYKVTKRTPKTLKMTRLESKSVSGDGMMGTCIATDTEAPTAYLREVSARVQESNYSDSETAWSAKHRLFFTIWNGQPKYYNRLD